MANTVHEDIEVKGNYVYINHHCIKFDTERQAQDFLVRLIVEENFLSR